MEAIELQSQEEVVRSGTEAGSHSEMKDFFPYFPQLKVEQKTRENV